MTWRDVFDVEKLNKVQDIYFVNKFIWEHTSYKFFAFNGCIFKTTNPEHFIFEDADTGLIVSSIA